MAAMFQQKRLAEAVKEEGRKIKGPSGTLDFYTLPLKAQPMNVEGCKCFIFGKDSGKKNRTILVLGATGAGKSTLVNRMINYILGVTWDDTFRFKLVDESTANCQAHSQTSEVTVYKLNHREGFQIDHSLTIVDTPGFGDTRGIERDRTIVKQLADLFSAEPGDSEIDAICFVAQASLARLTPTQKYIFDSVLAIFGKDVAENIRILVTFADNTKPLVLGAIKEFGVPCPKTKKGLPIHYKFNNTVPVTNNDEDDEKESIKWWDMGTKNMDNLFLDLKVIETKSLALTKEVLKQRAQLEFSLENINIKVKLALTKLEEINQKSEILKTHESAITTNAKYDYEVSVTRPVKVKTEEYSMNCAKCNITCHKSCWVEYLAFLLPIPFPVTNTFCHVFWFSGHCKECSCSVSNHELEDSYWGSETVKEKRTYEELKEKYEEASEKAMSVGDIIKQMELEYDQLQDEVVRLMEGSAQCLNTLREIALKPNKLSIAGYIDLLIEREKSEAVPGYQERINNLRQLKERAITTVDYIFEAGQSSG